MSETELWLCSPPGYPFGQKIAKTDIGGLKSFLISTTPDEQVQEMIRQMSDEEIVADLERNGFTFEEQWRPPQEISLDEAAQAWGRIRRG